MKKLLKYIYRYARRILNGRGLSKINFLNDANKKIVSYFKSEPKEFVIKHGNKIYLDPGQSMQEDIEEYEPELTKFVKSLKPSDVFVDIGAHIGWFTLLAAQTGAKVYSFEPLKESRELLEKNVKENGYTNVTIFSPAISDYNGMGNFEVGKEWGWSRLLENGDRKVEVRTLDSFNLSMTVVKMDTEGNELNVLRGMSETIKRCMPTIICEFISPENRKKEADYLSNFGFCHQKVLGQNACFNV